METLKWDGILTENTVVKTPAGDETYRKVFPWQYMSILFYTEKRQCHPCKKHDSRNIKYSYWKENNGSKFLSKNEEGYAVKYSVQMSINLPLGECIVPEEIHHL